MPQRFLLTGCVFGAAGRSQVPWLASIERRRLAASLLVTLDARGSDGTPSHEQGRYQPAKTPAGENRCVIGGPLPPGAVSAEAVDDRGRRIAAAVAHDAHVVMLEQGDDEPGRRCAAVMPRGDR